MQPPPPYPPLKSCLPQALLNTLNASAANQTQIGGNHYTRKAIQPWEVIERNGMGFFDGNALKYIMRYQDKGGVEDLKKAAHYIDKLIEILNVKAHT